MLDQWQPRQFVHSLSEMDADTFLASFGGVPFLLVDIADATDRLVSGLFHTSPLIRHDTPLMEEMTGATDLGLARGRGARKWSGQASSVAVEIRSDPSMNSRFLSPLSPRAGRTWQAGITVGRNLGNDLILKHQSISRVHAKFEQAEDGSLLLTDMASKNGSWINGSRLTGSRRVRCGDTLRLGQVEALLCDAEVLWQVVHPEVSTLTGARRR